VTEVRLLLARFYGDEGAPVVLAALDRTIWDMLDEDDEREWIAAARRLFGATESDYELREAWGTFTSDALEVAFHVPTAEGQVRPA